MNLRVFADLDELSEAAADQILQWTGRSRSITEQGSTQHEKESNARSDAPSGPDARLRVALSGGSTPQRLYRLLGQPTWRHRIDWNRIDLFWSDERCVPPDSPHSNYRLASDALLATLDAPPHIHRIHGEHPDPAQAAEMYESELRRAMGGPRGDSGATLDIVLLGLGADGHTASLFPGSAAIEEKARWVVPSKSPKAPHQRITMTLPLLNQARHLLFLVSGEDKAEALANTLLGPRQGAPPLPAAQVRPSGGEILWFVDRSAASQLR